MKILFFHRWVGVHGGGTETHLLELATRFNKLGHVVTILTRDGNRLGNLDKNIKVVRVSSNFNESQNSYDDWRMYVHTSWYMIKAFCKLLEMKLRGRSFDVVSVHFTTEAIMARFYRFLFGTPFVFVLEGYTPLEAKTAKAADKRLAISKTTRDAFWDKHGVDSEPIYVGVDTGKYTLDKNHSVNLRSKLAKKNELIVLVVCRLEPRKDLMVLIKAAEKIKLIDNKIKFVLCGDGISRESIEREIKRRKLTDTIKMVGFVYEELPNYYSTADIFALTTKEEWFGIVFIEAMAAGLPIVTTNVNACPEVVGNAGLFFDKGDYQGMVKQLLELAHKPKLRKELADNARRRSRLFDWKKLMPIYEKAYKSVLKLNQLCW